MRKALMVALAVVSLAAVVFAIPAFAQGPGGGSGTPPSQEAWQDMQQACASGDWQTMAEAAESFHGSDFGNASCHSQGVSSSIPGSQAPGNRWWGGRMGGAGGMMGRGGGMMGWR